VQAPDVLGFSCALLPADHLRLFSLVRARKDHRGVDLVSDALSFGCLWGGDPNAVSNAKFRSRSHDAVFRVYDEAGNMIRLHEEAHSSRAAVYK
jgi:hypothetical protein